ncbi:hypothetical protein V8F06_006352 [Rhypophila decipiens]
MGGGLANSRHAPITGQKRRSNADTAAGRALTPPWRPLSTPVETIHRVLEERTANGLSPPQKELDRATKIGRRLTWKTPFLNEGYQKAVDRVGRNRAQVQEAELMFKLDYFEYYGLIERALVHLMGVYGIRISADSIGEWKDGSAFFEYHAYHHNVLSALDDPTNPLHGVLGTGEVRKQLHRAKELRNRWKTAGGVFADDSKPYHHREGSPLSASRWATKKVAAPLESYRLKEILDTILAALNSAYAIASRFVETGVIETLEDGSWPFGDDDVDMIDWSIAAAAAARDNLSDEDLSDDGWNFMTDAMDWESI